MKPGFGLVQVFLCQMKKSPLLADSFVIDTWRYFDSPQRIISFTDWRLPVLPSPSWRLFSSSPSSASCDALPSGPSRCSSRSLRTRRLEPKQPTIPPPATAQHTATSASSYDFLRND